MLVSVVQVLTTARKDGGRVAHVYADAKARIALVVAISIFLQVAIRFAVSL